jgi:hypothetical protein
MNKQYKGRTKQLDKQTKDEEKLKNTLANERTGQKDK